MHHIDPAHYAIFFVGVGGIMFLITLTYLFSFLVIKIDYPKFKRVIPIAFFQVVLGILTIIFIKASIYDLFIVMLSAVAVLLVSGLFLVKLFLNYSWILTLSIWAVAGGIQVVVIPLCCMVLIFILSMLFWHFFPPQYLIYFNYHEQGENQ